MKKDKAKDKPPKYVPAVLDCPTCGEHVEGDMPVLSHAILGCKKKADKP